MGIGHLANLTCETIVCPRCSKHNRIGPSRGLISQVKSRFSQTQCPIWLWPDLAAQGVGVIAPHRQNRVHKTQDGRPLRRYKKRWRVERLFAWLHGFRRLVVRWEVRAENWLAFVQLGCVLILLRRCLENG